VLARCARLAALAAGLVCFEADAARPPPYRSASGARPRKLQRRTLVLTDANLNDVQVIHVAGGVPTSLSFSQPIRPSSVILADTSDAFLPLRATETSLVLLPRRDLKPTALATLSVTLADGTLLPLVLATVRGEADLGVDIQLALVHKARPESPAALKASLAQLHAELDECRANTGAAGVASVARMVLEKDAPGPHAFARMDVRRRDKQERLLVELARSYRLFGHTYLVLTLENRDPSLAWVLDHPELTATGNGQSADVHVVSFEMDVPSIGPNETGRLVIAFPTPVLERGGEFRLRLLEKHGTRHVRLDGLSL